MRQRRQIPRMKPEEKAAAEAKFLERVRGLIGVARKKKNILEYQEISDYFADLQLNEDQFDKLLELLEQLPSAGKGGGSL